MYESIVETIYVGVLYNETWIGECVYDPTFPFIAIHSLIIFRFFVVVVFDVVVSSPQFCFVFIAKNLSTFALYTGFPVALM